MAHAILASILVTCRQQDIPIVEALVKIQRATQANVDLLGLPQLPAPSGRETSTSLLLIVRSIPRVYLRFVRVSLVFYQIPRPTDLLVTSRAADGREIEPVNEAASVK